VRFFRPAASLLGNIRTQPGRDVRRLHRFSDYCQHVVAQGVEIGFLTQSLTEKAVRPVMCLTFARS
jgi:hypothetical protein